MTTRRNFLKQSLLAAGAASVPAGNLLAQEKMEEKRPKYNLPYKNTYLKEPFVTENEFRTAKPETITPGTFEEAKQILRTRLGADTRRKSRCTGRLGKSASATSRPRNRIPVSYAATSMSPTTQYLHVGLRLHDDVRPFRYPLLPLPTYVR